MRKKLIGLVLCLVFITTLWFPLKANAAEIGLGDIYYATMYYTPGYSTLRLNVDLETLGGSRGAGGILSINGGEWKQFRFSNVFDNNILFLKISDNYFYYDIGGLIPNSLNSISMENDWYMRPDRSGYWDTPYTFNYTVYTEPYTPDSLMFPTVGTNNLLLRWCNYSNAVDTSYTV